MEVVQNRQFIFTKPWTWTWNWYAKLEILEVGSGELADLKERKFWNLNLEINTTPNLETWIATMEL